MDLELRDKVAIVGGASKGLGRACAEVLAQEGAQVAMCSRSKDDLEKAASEIRAATGREVLVFAGDLDRPETIRDSLGALDLELTPQEVAEIDAGTADRAAAAAPAPG